MKANDLLSLLMAGLLIAGCTKQTNGPPAAVAESVSLGSGQSMVQDEESQKNVVQIAVGSKDHSTLVQAVQAAELVDALSNAGPFTVFAPTNDAFEKLPAGTVENLLKADQKDQLQNILQFHVAVGVYKTDNLRDGQVLGMVNGSNVTFGVSQDRVIINGANVIASVPASNGIIHIIDQVLLPGN